MAPKVVSSSLSSHPLLIYIFLMNFLTPFFINSLFINDFEVLSNINSINTDFDFQIFSLNETIKQQSLTICESLIILNNSSQEEWAVIEKPETNSPFWARSGDHYFTNYHDYAIYRMELELERRHKLRPDLSKEKIYDLMMGLDSESIQYFFDDIANQPEVDTSNIFRIKGQKIDVSKLTPEEVMHYLNTVDDTHTFVNLEHVKTLLHVSTPNVKLYYPEPFIASPSFVHNDIGFIHILQYQYWLWFFFIFLIIFFFLSFLVVVRWCAMRSQPRRETRGVSRSKCGDLITACVPVTWAISIIVSESTDASDNFDGFATSEIMIGIRAYQWGWEYYYPKGIDLQYNIRPSYSAFIGNSLKYNNASDKTLSTNNVWKYYQNKTDDAVITPAHLLVLPVDNNKMFNFMNFDNIGARTAKESNAFKKIRTYSKVFNTNLVHTPSTFTNKYWQINSLYTNENVFADSLNYGLKRQHNLTSSSATTNTYSTFLDKNSMDKFLNYTLQYNVEKQNTEAFRNDILTLQKKSLLDLNVNDVNKTSLLSSNKNSSKEQYLKATSRMDAIDTIYDDVDVERFSDVNTKVLETLMNDKAELTTQERVINSIKVYNFLNPTTSFTDQNFNNTSKNTKDFEVASNNQNFLSSDQSVRKQPNINPRISNYNLSNGFNTTESNLRTLHSINASDDMNSTAKLIFSKRLDQTTLNKLASNRMYVEAPSYPIVSNNAQLSSLDYDNTTAKSTKLVANMKKLKTLNSAVKGESVNILKGKRDGALKALSSAYWQMFWSNSNPDLRIESVLKETLNNDYSYIPAFTNYYDYDFRNAQSLELLEESFWETSYSSYNHLDYLNISEAVKKTPYTNASSKRLPSYYYEENTEELTNNESLTTPAIKDISLTGKFYSNSIQMDDYINQAQLVNTQDFSLYPLISTSLLIDDTYINSKNMNFLFNKNSNNLLNLTSNGNYPQSYISVLNNFRADFDDFAWHVELKQNVNKDLSVEDLNSTNDSNSTQVNNSRFSNPITLRTTARNSIVTYNALQKVFKSRFEDGRSNIKISHFSDLKTKQPFMNESRVPYEKLLGKNKESYYNSTFYKNNTFNVFNDYSAYTNSLNFRFFDFPFLLALKADSSRHLWFDWFAKWGFFEVQPSSSSRYSTLGVPYSRKHFDFNIESGDDLQNYETYFTRISKARKNYLPNWSYTPYLYTRSNVWNKGAGLELLTNTENSSLSQTRFALNEMKWYWQSRFFENNTSSQFTPSISGNNIFGKSTWRPYTSIQSYYYHNSALVDILTKREYLYRQYFESNQKIINLPKNLTSNPQNPLLRELKNSFLFIDPITYNSEYSRELYYNSLDYFKFIILKGWLLNLENSLNKAPINTRLVNDYLFYYFFNAQKSSKIGKNLDLYKSQFRPLKKGITSMLRLHATGAVAMPIETRLQILASSRDVIHSWSVPSAGVKIDCVPGYTSHRIMTFLTPGIYWGQCQEICGRYHHWMPIVVYFMKRDLFFLWCTHFMFNTNTNGTWEGNDKQFNDYVKFASYDKATWLSEVSQTF